jgi:hypothetical protein
MRHARLLSLLALAAGCSGGGATGNDLAVADLGADLAMPKTLDFATQPPVNTGTSLISSNAIDFINGVTSDDYVVYTSGNLVAAVSAAGGASKTIDANSQFATVSGTVVVSLSNPDSTTGQLTLTSWTSAGGAKTLSTNTASGPSVVSSDNAKILYLDNVSTDGNFTDVYLANADGTNAVMLLSQVTTGAIGCQPQLQFAGTRVLIAHCPDPGDAAVSTATLSSFLVAGGGPATIATDLQANESGLFYVTDAGGTKVLLFEDGSLSSTANPDGTGKAAIDTAMVLDGYLTNDASAAIYITAANALEHELLGSAATPLGPTMATDFAINFAGPFRSGDDKYVIWYNQPDPNGNDGISDLYLSATAANGTAVTLTDQPSGFIFGDAFTSDNSLVLYFTDTDVTANLSGTLKTMTLPSGTPTTIAPAVWEVHATGGTNIVYNDNYTETMVGAGTNSQTLQRGDVRVVNAATGASPKLLATQADVGLYTTTAKDKVIYLWNQMAGSEGIYIAPSAP